jgi:ankyrin repeat protein
MIDGILTLSFVQLHRTPLHYAAIKGNAMTTAALIAAKADPHPRDAVM